MMSGFRAYSLLLAVALTVLPACEKQGSTGVRQGVPIQLALSVGSKANSTKGNPAVITELSESVTFRGMTGITILPFDVREDIKATDQSVYYPSKMSDITCYTYQSATNAGGTYVDGLVENNHSHLYPVGAVSLPGGTASVLAYGYAPTAPADNEIRSRHLNGALDASGLTVGDDPIYASDIHFDPVPILTGGLPDAAQDLADALNAIIVPGNPSIYDIQYTAGFWYEDEEHAWHEASITVAWNADVDDLVLRECYQETTNSGNLIPGSGRSVEYMIARLYHRLKTHVIQNSTPVEYSHSGRLYAAMKEDHGSVPLTWGDVYDGLRKMLIARIETLDNDLLVVNPSNATVALADGSLRNYPGNLGLPEGSAILRWSGTRFYPVVDMAGDSEEGVAPVTSFCYPPRLWYFANTTISTSSADKSSIYTSEKTNWSDILSEYNYGKTVSGTTRSVALDQPLQFSCGMLVATVAATTDDLDDNDGLPGTTIPVNADTFPVTGVIIGSQQQLNFDFTPAGGREYFLYDDCISGLNLPTTPANPGKFYTFVSETPAGDSVYMCLELQNNSGKSFTGADGIVLPGSKFYLVGSIEAPNAVESVFQQDHITTINCTITSLKDALNAIPNLEKPHIALGIRISTNWTMSTPGHVILS